MVVGQSDSLEELFQPRSVAVIGASNRPHTVGSTLFRNIVKCEFQGVVYPVNPSWKSVAGVRCYPDVASLPEPPDLAVVIVPAAIVARTVEELGAAGTKGLIVISAGFREIGGDGVAREEELIRITRKYRMSVIGPNCFGLLTTHPDVQLNATFSDTLPPKGNIAFVSQSGALCGGILRYGIAERIGFSRFLSIGNRAGVDENDLLPSLCQDPQTRVILLYIESLADGRKFLEAAQGVTGKKPVLIIKSGRSAAGERAAHSHTGSLAQSGRDRLYDSLFEQSGVLRMDSIGELFRAAKVFSSGIKLDGPRLAILTNSGGPGVVAADAAARFGLHVTPLSDGLREKLAPRLPPSTSLGNPVDMTGDGQAAQYEFATRTLLQSPEYDGVLVIATPAGMLDFESVVNAIMAARARQRKPAIACLFGLSDISEELGRLEDHGIPAFTFPEEASQAISHLARYGAWSSRAVTKIRTFDVNRTAARRILGRARARGLTVLPEYEARALLQTYGIQFPKTGRAKDADEAVRVAEKIGFPVAMKVVSPDVVHKTDVGGVKLGLSTPEEVRSAWTSIHRMLHARAPHARIEGVELESMVPDGKEVIIGAQQDPSFGPIVLFGMGGIYVEILRDVTFRLAPMRAISAQRMVSSVRASGILRGVRGEPPGDLHALYEAIQRVSQLAVELPEVGELDINPMIVQPEGHGVIAVDARVALGPSSRSGPRASAAR
ncbi:MAG TPA: acetate--CoA ligase family protein [Thermoplasmata archaeon]|nr:acetate--CoA ligase family protein [Thermoplasmata archaeon]